MTIKFLGQGFEATSANAIGNYLITYLNQTNFHSFTGISAFASEAGIFGLAEHIQNAKQNFQAQKKIILVVGVDQQGTSKEALEELKNLNVESYIFYQAESPIFHPKIYLFEGDQETKLIVGSSNLTGRGLFVNVEGSLLVEFDNNDTDGINLLNELKSYFQSIFDLSDPNLLPISDSVIADFMAKGIVPDEATRRRAYNAKIESSTQQPSEQNRINIPPRKVASIPSNFPRKPRTAFASTPTSIANQPSNHLKSDEHRVASAPTSIPNQPSNRQQELPQSKMETTFLLWESGPLTERDLNIPKGSTTNATGSMLIKKGKLKNIDQRHYFRDVLFNHLDWKRETKKRTAHYERVKAKFELLVDGKNYGTFELQLSHNMKTELVSYHQNQPMTSLSWGAAKPIIAKDELIGKSAKLYGKSEHADEYLLVID